MKLHHYLVSLCVVVSGLPAITHGTISPLKGLISDTQALDYCKQTKNTYIVIVWPRGFDQLDYITKTLNSCESVVPYVKQFALTKKSMFWLYRKLHTMSYQTAKKYFKPYASANLNEPLQLAALVLHTDKPLETILGWKKEIRNYIGASYYSIHINNVSGQETIDAARAVFKDIKQFELTDVTKGKIV